MWIEIRSKRIKFIRSPPEELKVGRRTKDHAGRYAVRDTVGYDPAVEIPARISQDFPERFRIQVVHIVFGIYARAGFGFAKHGVTFQI